MKNLLHIAWATVGNIIERVVARKIDRARLERLYRVGIDEVSYRKGHKYLTVVADHDTGDPVWIGEGRSQATVGAFFDELGERAKQLEAVSMDMCAPYVLETKAGAPQDEIAFDPFHVVKLANEAVHDVRRTEARERKGSAELWAVVGGVGTLGVAFFLGWRIHVADEKKKKEALPPEMRAVFDRMLGVERDSRGRVVSDPSGVFSDTPDRRNARR